MNMRTLTMTALLIGSISSTGCSVIMAANQPGEKNTALFQQGTTRSAILAEFGQPTGIEVRDGKTCEVYKFKQGYSKGAKATRVFTHAVGDVLSCGLWEVIGTPVEAVADGDNMAYLISYNDQNAIDYVEMLNVQPEKKIAPKKED